MYRALERIKAERADELPEAAADATAEGAQAEAAAKLGEAAEALAKGEKPGKEGEGKQ